MLCLRFAEKSDHIEGTQAGLQAQLNQDPEANIFFEALSKSYKQSNSDFVVSARHGETRKVRACKAMIMLRN